MLLECIYDAGVGTIIIVEIMFARVSRLFFSVLLLLLLF